MFLVTKITIKKADHFGRHTQNSDLERLKSKQVSVMVLANTRHRTIDSYKLCEVITNSLA